MGFSTAALAGYCEKCGASSQDARLFALVGGEEFIDRQNSARLKGLGNLAKASAATNLADSVLYRANNRDDQFPLPSQLTSRDDLEAAIQVIRATAMCSVAVYGYALAEDHTSEMSDSFAAFLQCSKVRQSPVSAAFDVIAMKDAFEKDATRQAIESMALGRRKGFFSGILG